MAHALANQRLGSAVRSGHQIGVAFVLNLQPLMEVLQKQRARLTSDGLHGGKETVVRSLGHG